MTIGTRVSGVSDSAIIHEIIATAGWGITRECVQVVLTLDPQAYVLGLDESGHPNGVGFGLGFHHSAWIGHLVVKPESRGQGLGHRLFEALLTRVRDLGKWPVYLTATEMGAPLYAKFGFVEDGSLTRWEMPKSNRGTVSIEQNHANLLSVRTMETADLEEIVEFDTLRFGDNRGKLLRLFHMMYPKNGLISRTSDGQVAGYLLGGTLGLGPFVADDEAAEPLLIHLLTMYPQGVPPALTFLDSNIRARELCKAAGLEPTRTWVRMKLGDGCEPQDETLFNMSVAHG
ncbi:MAG: GNAT family N-acetyltransferase [Firmicutes bacterium]|nr:GNAT family N-acetyltransferase [Bacillota bacterium]